MPMEKEQEAWESLLSTQRFNYNEEMRWIRLKMLTIR